MTPLLSPTPCDVAETKALEEEYPEAFPVCVVTRSQVKAVTGSTTNEVVAKAPAVVE